MIGFKLVLLVAILAAGALGGALPLRRRGPLETERFLGFGNALAAGIFLGAGLVHMLPDAARAWTELGWQYPMAYLLAALGFVVMLLVEHVLLPESAHEMVHAPPGDRFTPLPERGGTALAAYTVLTALSVHSFLEGLALGAEPELARALVIFVAIIAHKTTAGFALGVSLVRQEMPRSQAWALLALFASATPAGILIGAGIGESLAGPTRLAFEASFLSLAAGSFAYVATLDILRDEFAAEGGRFAKWLLVCAGTALMGVVAIWI